MRYVQGKYPLLAKNNIARGIYEMNILAPDLAALAVPGQFVHIALAGHSLRRPISICRIDEAHGVIKIVFALKGQGTRDLADVPVNSTLDIMGPMGNGFTLLEPGRKVILVGGGIGVPPMVGLSDYYREYATAISGFRDASIKILQDEFEKNGSRTILCTDDGSAGIHGFVTQPLEELLSSDGHYDCVYACGPMPMLKVISGICGKYDTLCQVSLEQHMGCGIGACLVCAVNIRRDGEEHFLHVCKDGPVFDSREVVW